MSGEPQGERPAESAGEWVSVAEAARRLGVSPRAVRKRIEHRSITYRPKGNAGREVFLPAGTAPRGASREPQGSVPSEAPGDALGEPAELWAELLEERTARVEAVERAHRAELEAAHFKGEAAAKDALVVELRGRAERAESEAARFAAELVEL